MVRNLSEVKDESKAKRGSQQTWTEDDLRTVTLYEDTYRDILKERSTESAKYYLGHGMRSRDDPNAGYFYVDLRATGNGTGAADAEVGGLVRFVVYADSEDEVPIVGDQFNLRDLREAASDARTERPVLPLQLPGAGKDKAIAIQARSDSASDGAEVGSGAASANVLIPYTQILE